MARPSKLTPETQEAICQSIREGNTIKYSVQKEGITEHTYQNWTRRGRESKTQNGKYFTFFTFGKLAVPS